MYYKVFFSCDSKDALYVLICDNCDFFHIGQTEESKQVTRKNKSDINPSSKSNCKKCWKNLKTCS